MLLHDLTIENYRSFAKYKLSNLARVNLLVGDNNCGKTSVLEAVALLCATSPMKVASRILFDRGAIDSYSQSQARDTYYFDFRRSMFYRDDPDSGVSKDHFEITSSNNHSLQSWIGDMDSLRGVLQQVRGTSDFPSPLGIDLFSRVAYAGYFLFRRPIEANPVLDTLFQSDAKGRLRVDLYDKNEFNWITEDPFDSFPISMLWATGPSTKSLSDGWSGLIKQRQEDAVVDAIKIVLPDVDGLVVLPNTSNASNSRLSILLGSAGTRTPISDYGEGTSRLVSIGIVLASTPDGVAVIDEIDTGLHYSRLTDMWRMVIKTAAALDVQVFATTHSLDCIRGLAEAVEQESESTDQVAIFRIDRTKDEAVRFGGDELAVVVDHEIEVR